MLAHFLRQLHEQAAALHGGQLAPRAVEGRTGGLHGGIDVSRLAARDLIEHLPVRWVEHIDGLPCQGRNGLVGDEIQLHDLDCERVADFENHRWDMTQGTWNWAGGLPMKKARQGGPSRG